MPRRGHKKSRAGCADCKRRHVKCDETQPSCINCRVAALICSYIKSSNLLPQHPRSNATTPAYSPLTPETSTVPSTTQSVRPSPNESSDYINLDHLELLHHYDISTCHLFVADTELALSFRGTAMSHALRYPFLMYALLALSAMHLRHLRPERSDHYHALATSLQAAGLAAIKDILPNITTDNCVAIFLFSTTTGMHAFSDTFSYRDQNFSRFLDKLTGCIQLMRGVRLIMVGGWWEYLRTTALANLLSSGGALDNPTDEGRNQLEPLRDLLAQADLGETTLKIYEEAVSNLQRVFNAESKREGGSESANMVFAWLVILSHEYNELLIQRRPEALVILAYYGVVLHWRQDAWAIGDSGSFLIISISDYLGKHWERWLVWPRTVISSTPADTAVNTP